MASKISFDQALLRRHKQKERKRKTKKKMSCRILIVTEGEKTEPNYFRKFQVDHNSLFIYEVECKGLGKNTLNVVDEAIRLSKSRTTSYDSVWAVFDRDSFSANNFNSAIKKAEDNGINAAWSNEAFELWFLYHFQNRKTAMSRYDYEKAISDAVNNSKMWKSKKAYKYDKCSEENYSIMTKYGNQEQAIKYAEKQHSLYTDTRYADHNPCTTVYKLVLQLLNRDKDLIAAVMEEINKE